MFLQPPSPKKLPVSRSFSFSDVPFFFCIDALPPHSTRNLRSFKIHHRQNCSWWPEKSEQLYLVRQKTLCDLAFYRGIWHRSPIGWSQCSFCVSFDAEQIASVFFQSKLSSLKQILFKTHRPGQFHLMQVCECCWCFCLLKDNTKFHVTTSFLFEQKIGHFPLPVLLSVIQLQNRLKWRNIFCLSLFWNKMPPAHSSIDRNSKQAVTCNEQISLFDFWVTPLLWLTLFIGKILHSFTSVNTWTTNDR